MTANLSQHVFSAEQVRTHESAAAAQCGVAMYTLMERAGQAVFEQAIKYFPQAQNYVVMVWCGKKCMVTVISLQASLNRPQSK